MMVLPNPRSNRGVALVMTLLAIGLLSALGLALAMSSALDRLAGSNHDDAVDLLNMADAALELAARDLAAIDDWNAVLTGAVQSPRADGAPGGVRRPSPGVVVDLTVLTNELSCGRPTTCNDASVRAVTSERPWGSNNPRWRPFLYTALDGVSTPRRAGRPYVVVWVGDDASEVDGNVLTDGGGPAAEGRYILRAHAEAFGPRGARRGIEADLARVCIPSDGGEWCFPATRVHSWRSVAAAVP
jgi:hypothetical protein